jgi:hypothetical protein
VLCSATELHAACKLSCKVTAKLLLRCASSFCCCHYLAALCIEVQLTFQLAYELVHYLHSIVISRSSSSICRNTAHSTLYCTPAAVLQAYSAVCTFTSTLSDSVHAALLHACADATVGSTCQQRHAAINSCDQRSPSSLCTAWTAHSCTSSAKNSRCCSDYRSGSYRCGSYSGCRYRH